MIKELNYRNSQRGREHRPSFEQTIYQKRAQLNGVFENYQNTEEENELLSQTVSIFKSELDHLGLDSSTIPVPSIDNMHFISERGFLKLRKFLPNFPLDTSGINFPLLGEIALMRKDSRLEELISSQHEIIHFASFNNISINWQDVFERRSGYSLSHGRLNGFNEGIVQRLTAELVIKNFQSFNEVADGETEEEAIELLLDSYTDEQSVLKTIIDVISKHRGEDRDTTWMKIKKGLFTGHMMHLRDIDRAFGKGSLKLLSLYGSSPSGDPEKDRKIDELILRYFTSADDSERPDLYNQIWDTF